jgi:hypothetical protein
MATHIRLAVSAVVRIAVDSGRQFVEAGRYGQQLHCSLSIRQKDFSASDHHALRHSLLRAK